MTLNRQVGPDHATHALTQAVAEASYKPGWTLTLEELDRGQGSQGLTLCIGFTEPDSTNPSKQTTGLHLFPVLPAAYGREAWEHWILECILMVEKHEAMEWLKFNGHAPFFPDHGPGRNPYELMRIKPAEQAQEDAETWHGGPATDQHFQVGRGP